jgi:23S rRNA A1618 N6-methylase RlmF
MAAFMLPVFFAALAVPGVQAETREELLGELREMRQNMDASTPDIDDLFSVVNDIETRNSASSLPMASPVHKELIDELRSARQQMEPKVAGSVLRNEIIAELRSARQEVEPEVTTGGSPLRNEIIDELRSARQQVEPEVTNGGSLLRNEIMDELRSARQQMEPQAPSRSALRDEIVSELRSAREQSDFKAAPSALRKTIVEELRAARQKVLFDELISDDVELPRIATEEQKADSSEQAHEELPWSDEEELLTETDVVETNTASVPLSASTSPMAEGILAFNRLLRTLVLYGTALGLATVAKLPELDLKTQGRSPAYLMTLVLFFVPLLAASVDFVFDLAVGNEFALIACCWGLAAMACLHERVKQQ